MSINDLEDTVSCCFNNLVVTRWEDNDTREVLETIMDLSARVIVNPVSMQMENERISDLIIKCRKVLKEAE